MNRTSSLRATRRRPSVLLAACMGIILIGGTSLFLLDLQRTLILPGGLPAASAWIEKSTPEVPSTLRQMSAHPLRGAWLSRQTTGRRPGSGLKRELGCVLPDSGMGSSRLDYCAEFTKPDSLVIRLMGSPKNHLSPPA